MVVNDPPTYLCVQQRAGPFVKAFVTDRKCFLRRNRVDIQGARKRCGPAMSRTSVDKLELRLALFGFDGIFYTLTFADEHLPDSLDGVMHVWDAFCKRLKRFCKKPMDYYVYRVEGLHGDHRYHIHAFMRDADFPPAVVRYLWVWGEAYDVPYDQKRVMTEQGYRGLAIYFTKELPDVGRHPWGCSRKLSKLIPPPEVHLSDTGQLRVPRDATRLPIVGKPEFGGWGVFNYTRYLLPKK